MKTARLFTECEKTCVVIFLSLILMTAGFVLTLMGWFAPPMNNFVLNVRMGGSVALLTGFLLMCISCILCSVDQGKCCQQCNKNLRRHKDNYRRKEPLVISNNHIAVMADNHFTTSAATLKGYHELDTVVNIDNKQNTSCQTYTTILSALPETPQDVVDILSYQQNTLSLENHISNCQYSKHVHKKQNANKEQLLRKDYQSRNLHNTQTVPPIHQNNHVIQTDTTEKLYQTQSETLAFNNKSLGRQLKLKATTCVPYECLTQTDNKLKLHPETLHN